MAQIDELYTEDSTRGTCRMCGVHKKTQCAYWARYRSQDNALTWGLLNNHKIKRQKVCPIVRGKAAAPVESGARISASRINGMAFLDRHSWDACNECNDVVTLAECFKARTGHYPVSIHADKIYRTRRKCLWCKERNTRLSGPPLGRPVADTRLRREPRNIQRQDELGRIAIEGVFGVGKRRFSLANIMTKLRNTSEQSVALIFVPMNINKSLRELLSLLCLHAIARNVKEQFEYKPSVVACWP